MGIFIESAIRELNRECQEEFQIGLKEAIQKDSSIRIEVVEDVLRRVHFQVNIVHKSRMKFFLRNAPQMVIKIRTEIERALNQFPNDQQIEKALKKTISNLLDDFLEKAS